MKTKNIILCIILLLIVIFLVIFMVGKKNRNKDGVSFSGEAGSSLVNPAKPLEYKGNLTFYIENRTEKDINSITITSYDNQNQVVSTTTYEKDKINQDENNIIDIIIPDDEDVKWNIGMMIDAKEYKLLSPVDSEVISNQSLVILGIEGENLVVLEDE